MCISLHACNATARHLCSAFDKNLHKEINFSIKIGEIKGFNSLSKQHGVKHRDHNNNEDITHRLQLANANEKMIEDTKSTKAVHNRAKKVDGIKRSTSGALKSSHDQSLVSVSWRVPYQKPGEKNPAFNLDYSPPKTHPPSHN
ncbi:Synaptonemal complex protein like [Quillaja saponaria]|uniref:Synaptonemal complex protein like n=1 Tax=Quillaja saponaria TaxID=32244 RepID=A0AAD7LPT0_QUISA|nr:Synaptonemal complex protein like [Quillaja saponaria]